MLSRIGNHDGKRKKPTFFNIMEADLNYYKIMMHCFIIYLKLLLIILIKRKNIDIMGCATIMQFLRILN